MPFNLEGGDCSACEQQKVSKAASVARPALLYSCKLQQIHEREDRDELLIQEGKTSTQFFWSFFPLLSGSQRTSRQPQLLVCEGRRKGFVLHTAKEVVWRVPSETFVGFRFCEGLFTLGATESAGSDRIWHSQTLATAGHDSAFQTSIESIGFQVYSSFYVPCGTVKLKTTCFRPLTCLTAVVRCRHIAGAKAPRQTFRRLRAKLLLRSCFRAFWFCWRKWINEGVTEDQEYIFGIWGKSESSAAL